MKIKNILIPTDFSETGMLAIEHAGFMASLYKANLYLFHVIEISETSYSIYNPVVEIKNLGGLRTIVENQLDVIAKKLKKEYAITVNTICSTGRTANEILTTVEEHQIDIVIMGTHGAHGFDELFFGSNAHKVIAVCPCPVITVQTHAKKLGFANIILPIDGSLHSRQKVDDTIALAKKYASNIHVLGIVGNDEESKKMKLKLESVEKVISNNGLSFETKIIKGNNLAQEALKYSKKMKADLIVVMEDHESYLKKMFLGSCIQQIVNHSRIPVMSVRPIEGHYESISMSAASPF
jgi:nucleotide-binding universal stress UspA family protein